MPKGEITHKMVKLCYEKAQYISRLKNPTVEFKQWVAKSIHDETEMNSDSAMMYIHAFLCMREGKRLGMSMSKDSVRYYFEQIQKDYGDDGLKKALQSVRLYLEDSIPGLRVLVNEFEKKIKDSEKLKVILHKKNVK